jgi:hypothetical protein
MPREDLPEFLRALSAYDGAARTRLALRLAVLTFVRTTELRAARSDEVDLEAAEWRIPAERMKMRAPHIVPLSRQAIETLNSFRHLLAVACAALFRISQPAVHRASACRSWKLCKANHCQLPRQSSSQKLTQTAAAPPSTPARENPVDRRPMQYRPYPQLVARYPVRDSPERLRMAIRRNTPCHARVHMSMLI